MTDSSGLRKHPRALLDSEVNLSWEDAQGVHRHSRGKCVNVSERGLGLLVPDEIPVRSYVNFRVESLRFVGSGSVRSIRRKGPKYAVGLEFAGTLRLPKLPGDEQTREG